MLKVIGLCGGSGSGKGAVGAVFSKNGYLTIDTDKVYREIIDNDSHCLDALVCEFGGEILSSRGTLERKKLAEIVFSDRKKLNMLNTITHKFILDKVRTTIKEAEYRGYAGVVVDAPLLYESGFDQECDSVVAVVADTDLRIERIIRRDAISRDAAIQRINSQNSDQVLRSRADFIIENNGDLISLERAVINIITKINN